MTYADLEIGLHRRDAESYGVELRFSPPETDADVRLVRGGLPVARFDTDLLRQQALDDRAYGTLLTEGLFGDPGVRSLFAEGRIAAESLQAPLRIRLFVGPSAPELHNLHWETLRDPGDGAPLFTGERILFSRYLSSIDWRPVRRRPKGALRALVLIANPVDLAEYQPGGRPLAPLDVGAELTRARDGLAGIPCNELASGGSATADNLFAGLRDGYDILYLVGHGAIVDGEPWLWLEDEKGQTHRMAGSDLLVRIRELGQIPTLIVLASCQSAGSGTEAHTTDAGALAALGPRLAEAGVPAVLAMQGDVSMTTHAAFISAFFSELQRDGQLDRAVAVARGGVRERPDWWVPVLFMRLRSGCIWYASGFTGERRLEKWPALLSHIRAGSCTPILGPGLTDTLLGSRREIAKRWAETYHFPMAPHNREDLPQVAQYLAVNQGEPMFPHGELVGHLRREIIGRYGNELPDELRESSEPPIDHLAKLISAVGAQRRERDAGEPFRVLASLPLPIYITSAQHDLLTDALRAAGKQPRADLCRWNEDIRRLPSPYGEEPDFQPDPQRPLVYHLFGRLQYPESLVLTEDDYFDFLIGATSNKDVIPIVIRYALANTGLLFLGFQLDDWNFRVLYRSIMSQEGGKSPSRRQKKVRIAAQIDPEEGRILEPERARRYLEGYFQESDISIYWGSADDFARDLLHQWEDRVP